MKPEKNICLVVPTIRENSFNDFVSRWKAIGLFNVVDLMVMEDNPTKTFKSASEAKYHYCWEDIRKTLAEAEWIIPRRSDTVRSFAYLQAYKLGYKFIMTLDDDCYPTTDEDGLKYSGEAFVQEHLKNLEGKSRWFNTLNSVKPRGIPFYNTGKFEEVIVNHGLWTNVLDYDAPYQLANPIKEKFSFDNKIVPHGLYFPMCGMNVMWKAEATILMYHLLMGKRVQIPYDEDRSETDKDGLVKMQFDRFGDIWAGILMKKVADRFNNSVTTGMPYIRHERASNPFTNLKKEANGIEVNEDLWQFVDSVNLSDAFSYETAYAQLGKSMKEFTKLHPKYHAEHGDYFELLGEAMRLWSSLFR